MKSPLSPKVLADLKSHLRHGDITMIAKKCKCCKYTVNLFFRGETYRDSILETVMNMIEKRASISDRLEKIMSKYETEED